VSEKSYGKQIKVPVGSIPKAHTWLPDGALASEVQNCGCKQASGAYTAVAQDAKMEILVEILLSKGCMICRRHLDPIRQKHHRLSWFSKPCGPTNARRRCGQPLS